MFSESRISGDNFIKPKSTSKLENTQISKNRFTYSLLLCNVLYPTAAEIYSGMIVLHGLKRTQLYFTTSMLYSYIIQIWTTPGVTSEPDKIPSSEGGGYRVGYGTDRSGFAEKG